MGQENSSSSSVTNSSNASETQVMLNVYDLTPLNQYTSWVGFGIFHSGIEVHGMEYGFGAHDFPISGVFEVEPKTCPGFIYRCSVRLGRISMLPSEFRTFIETVASEYHGDTYHLISKNCNHFTDDLAQRLTGKGIPGWVNRLAHLGAFCSCLLPESLQLTTVKQLPEYHPCTEESCPIDFGHCHGPEEEEEEDGSASFASTPGDVSESDDGEGDEDKQHLLSTLSTNGDVGFVKEASR